MVRNVVVVRGDNLYKDLENVYKENYVNILPTRRIAIGNLDLVKVSFLECDKSKLVKYNGSAYKKLKGIVDSFNKFSFVNGQSDPKILQYNLIGNCQAVSLLFKAQCENNNISCDILYDTTHMWNRVKIEDKSFDIDIVNERMEEVA